MKDPRTPMISVEEALQVVLREAAPLPIRAVPIREAAGRVLAEEILAGADQPPFPKALVDGYALRAADLASLPADLVVVEEIPAGRMPGRAIGPGQAARIMTGAPVPEGADAVQMMEKAESADPDRVRILEAVPPGANVAPRGREIQAGEKVLSPGDLLTPARLGLLASVGRAEARVRAIPKVAIAVTGNELVEAGHPPAPGQIRNSNGPALAARARAAGARVLDLGIVPDDPAALRDAIRRGLKSNLFLISGGVSMGVHDLVEDALAEEGVEIFFRKVAIRPGKPAVFGRKGGCLVFGLPGNPVSSLVVFEVFAAAALRAMAGCPAPEGRHLDAVLEEEIRQMAGRTGYVPGHLLFAAESARIRPLPTSGSADLLAYSRANALLVVPADRDRLLPGDRVRVLLLD